MRSELRRFLNNLLDECLYDHPNWEKEHLTSRNWRAFEELISILWNDMGYKTSLQQGKRDGGVDVIAKGTNRIPFSNPPTIAIQAKNWKKKVREPKVRDLYGVQNGGHRQSNIGVFDESILVTSSGCVDGKSGFTQGARQFAEANGIELIDGAELLELLNKSNLSPLRLGRKPGKKWHLRESPCCGWSKKYKKNNVYGQTTQEIFHDETQQVVSAGLNGGPLVAMEDLCEACMNLRLE
ncbi:restriction endonuclease [Halovenus aranensis]|uniref:restriction endonuclease n=1 Tax=Halovenus aranensis TaxID=890420 RepID=UPI000B84E58C|nr:restriction endonuclease [Halovenus aranensis]